MTEAASQPNSSESSTPITGSVAYAWALRQGALSNGRDHIVLDDALEVGQLRRAAGDALCRPRRKFRDLSPGSNTATGHATCPVCLQRAERYNVVVEARPSW